jgi:adenosine deaminase
MELVELIRALPKVEQHVHIVGSTRPETLLWLAEESGEDSPFQSLEDVKEYFVYRDFSHFIQVYSAVVSQIREESQFERLTYEMLEEDARCNVRYVEASFSAPDHVRKGLDYGLMLNAINRGIRRAGRDFNIECDLRIDLVRNYGPECGMEVLDWIEVKGDKIVAVDIGGSEGDFPPEPYEDVYERAREMGLHLVAHAGEAAGPESVWGAIKYLGVERIGHGVSAIEDLRLMDHIREQGITIESCPVSNLRTGVVASLREHPIREFFDRRIKVTVNSDDPSMFGTNMNNEYVLLNQELGFTPQELFKISLNAIESSFLPEREKERLMKSFKKEYISLNSNQ